MSSKITQVHIWGIYNTTMVGNASFMTPGSKNDVEMQTELKSWARFPESLYEPLI